MSLLFPNENTTLESTPVQTPPLIENTPISPIIETVGFLDVLKGTLSLYKEKFYLFLAGTLANFAIIAGLNFLLLPLILKQGLGGSTFLAALVIGLTTLLLSYLFYGTMSHQAGASIRNESIPLSQSMSSTLKNLWKFIVLCLRMFMYSRIWLVLLGMFVYPFVMIFGMALGPIGLIGINFLLGLGGLALVIYSIIRMLRTTLAIPALMAYPQISAKDALADSVEMIKNRWWSMLSFLTVFGFLMGIIPTVINFLAALTKSGTIQMIALVASAIFGLLTYTASISFSQILVSQFSDSNKTIKLNIGVLIGAIIIISLPFLLAISAPLLGLMALKNSFSSLPTSTIPVTQEAVLDDKPVDDSRDSVAPAEIKKPRLPKSISAATPQAVGNKTAGTGVAQKVFDDLQNYLFESEIWTQYYPMFAKDEKAALDYSAHLGSSMFVSPASGEKPMFAPFEKILNYLGKGMYDYKKIDEKIGDATAFYLYTATAMNLHDFSDTRRFTDLYCYPFVKEDGEWKMKIARFIPSGSYKTMSLTDPEIIKICEDVIKPQPAVTKDLVKKRLNFGYESNLNFDIYLNNHLLEANNIDSTRPGNSGSYLEYLIKNGENEITVKTGSFDKEKLEQAKMTLTVEGIKTVEDPKGIDEANYKPETGYKIGGKTTSGGTVTALDLIKKIGELTLGAKEEKSFKFIYDKDSDALSPL